MTEVLTYRDDPKFDAVRTEQWFIEFPDTILSLLPGLTFEVVGLGFCGGCTGFEICYKCTDATGESLAQNLCNKHIRNDILQGSAPFSWRREYTFTNDVTDLLLPPLTLSLDHLPHIDVEQCGACNKGMYTAQVADVVKRNWYSDGLVPRVAKDVNSFNVTAHKACTFLCEQCGISHVLKGDNAVRMYNVNNETVCKTCWDSLNEDYTFMDCDGCSTLISEDISNSSHYSEYRDSTLCYDCYNNSIECGDCGYEFYENDGHECEEDTSSYIHSYGYKPRPVFYGKADYHLGLELEVEARNGDLFSGAEYVYSKIGDRAYLKYDGSLSNGFEIVTHPHSLHEMQNKFPWEILPWLQDEGFRSWNTSSCGIHVHVSRSAFKDDAHQIKFTKLIYDNQRQVERVAGRKSSYAKFNDKGKIVRKVKTGYSLDDRYSAVNNENENTLEVRVFRGSLRKERVLSAIEFTHAAVEYTRTIKMVAKDKPLSWARFIAFVVLNHQTYPNLLTIIGELFDKENEVIDQEEVNN